MKALNYEALGAAISGFSALAVLTGWLWNTRNIATNARDDLADLKAERDRDKVTWGQRLQKAEQTAESMNRLADAVESGSRITAMQIANLSEKVAEHATFAKEQFADIRHEQKAVRAALGEKPSARARGN